MQLKIEGVDKQGPIQLDIGVNNQFAATGQWLKGNLHCHVGGMGEPKTVCNHYKQLGYDFLVSSDYEGIYLAAIGVDDAHRLPDENVVGQTFTGILTNSFTKEGILQSIRTQRTYASEGPEIRNIQFTNDGTIKVECSSAIACHFMSHGSGARTILAEKPDQQDFELDLQQNGYRLRDWLSVCIENSQGKRAWSSAIKLQVEITKQYSE